MKANPFVSTDKDGFKRTCHSHKKTVCIQMDTYRFWCERRDLNPYESPHTPLKRARLPIPPLSRQR